MGTRGFRIAFAWMTPALLAAALTAQAQAPRPGIDRPIRVAMFKGHGSGADTWHTNIHTSHNVMASLLANPAQAGLGPNLEVPPAGFTFHSMPVGADSANQCVCLPTAERVASFAAALDSFDVLVMSSASNLGALISEPAHRQAFQNFWAAKGYVAIHAVTDSKGTWTPLDSIHGTQFNNHPVEQTAQIRRDSVHQDEAAWQYLNRGLFSNGTDTSFFEEWLFYTNSGAQIRARADLKPTVRLVETGMTGISSIAMGDHPLSWYRQLPTGGRMFYTGMGHRANVWQGNRVFRRQIYNAILWASQYGLPTAIQPGNKGRRAARDGFRVSRTPGAFMVTVLPEGPHTLELTAIDGRRIALKKSDGTMKSHDFRGLRSGIYAVSVTTSAGRSRSLVAVE
jgi:type 1 glutamine amidotransferase